jgi:hypothetical protein
MRQMRSQMERVMARFARSLVALRAPPGRTSAPNSSAQSASRLLNTDRIKKVPSTLMWC